MKLFVSYSQVDKRFVRRLCDDLLACGFDVWRDEREVRVGQSIAESIRSAVDASDYFLVVISPHSNSSPWVRRELDLGINAEFKGTLRGVLPILRDGVGLPSLLEGRLYADFRPRKYGQGLKSLLHALEFSIDEIVVLAGAPMKAKNIELIEAVLVNFGCEVVDTWTPVSTKVEVTGGYLSYMRGDRESRPGAPSTFSPISPIPRERDTSILSGEGIQACFAVMRVDFVKDDFIEYENMRLNLAAYRYVIYVSGKFADVRRVLEHLNGFVQARQIEYLKYDIPDLLLWWDSPTLPNSRSVVVSVS
jgi:TIR domain-containing protein